MMPGWSTQQFFSSQRKFKICSQALYCIEWCWISKLVSHQVMLKMNLKSYLSSTFLPVWSLLHLAAIWLTLFSCTMSGRRWPLLSVSWTPDVVQLGLASNSGQSDFHQNSQPSQWCQQHLSNLTGIRSWTRRSFTLVLHLFPLQERRRGFMWLHLALSHNLSDPLGSDSVELASLISPTIISISWGWTCLWKSTILALPWFKLRTAAEK